MLERIAPYPKIYSKPSLNEYLIMFYMTIGSLPGQKKDNNSKIIRASLKKNTFFKCLFETNLTVPSTIGLGEVEIR